MPDVSQKNAVLNVVADITDNKLEISDAISNEDGSVTALIQVITATTGIRFGLGTAAGGYQWPAGSKFWITYKPGVNDLYYQKTNATDTFVPTV